MLRQGAGDLLTYLAARSLRLGVIAGPQTSPREFESFVRQLRQQSIRVTTAVSPEDLELDGVEAGVVRASRELGMGEGGRGGADVLLVGSSNPLLSAATEANMFTARYYPPNSRREGVIQTFVVRDIDEVCGSGPTDEQQYITGGDDVLSCRETFEERIRGERGRLTIWRRLESEVTAAEPQKRGSMRAVRGIPSVVHVNGVAGGCSHRVARGNGNWSELIRACKRSSVGFHLCHHLQ